MLEVEKIPLGWFKQKKILRKHDCTWQFATRLRICLCLYLVYLCVYLFWVKSTLLFWITAENMNMFYPNWTCDNDDMYWYKRGFPFCARVEECCLASQCVLRSSERAKCISAFGGCGMWSFPLCSIAHVLIISSFILMPHPLLRVYVCMHIFFSLSVPWFRSIGFKANQVFFYKSQTDNDCPQWFLTSKYAWISQLGHFSELPN